MSQPFYKVYIACMTKNADGNTTKDCILARQLYRRLEQKGIHTFLTEKCNPDDRTEALDSALVLVVAGRSAASLMSDEVRNDYEDFIAGVELSGKRKWRVFNYLLGLQHDDLPGYLRNHRSYEHYRTDELVEKIEQVLSADDPRTCILEDPDRREDSMPPAARELPECLPDCAESAREAGDSGDDEEDLPLRRRARARRAPQSFPEEKRTDQAAKQPSPEGAEGSNAAPLIPPVPSVPSMPSMPSMPSTWLWPEREKMAL